MSIGEWQQIVDNWIKQYGVRYFDITTNNLLLVEELGEFTRLIARRYGEQSFKEALSEAEVDLNIREEMADMLFVITCLANQMGINLTDILQENIAKKTARDNTRHINNPLLHS